MTAADPDDAEAAWAVAVLDGGRLPEASSRRQRPAATIMLQ